MPDIGWQELFLIALVTILVVGPKEIPRVLRTVSLWIRKIRGLARDFQSGIDDLAREADLEDIRKELTAAKDFDVQRNIEEMIDPTGEYAKSIQNLEEPDEPDEPDEPEPQDDLFVESYDPVDNALESPEETEQPVDDTPAKTSGA